MAFNFDFSADEEDAERGNPTSPSNHLPPFTSLPATKPTMASVALPLSSLLSSLPGRLSYSTVKVGSVTLPRRDLFDARFQMVSEGEDNIGVDSDLIPGSYEGGLKTWECSLDLVSVLQALSKTMSYHGKRIVELGCGTALPSLYLLQRLLADQPTSEPTYLHLCDFNAQVLSLVTLPNLLLAFHFSAAPESLEDAGEVEVTDELVDAFLAALKDRQIHLAFHSGPWQSLDLAASRTDQKTALPKAAQPPSGPTADLVLTSETTYNIAAVSTLIEVMRRISRPSSPPSNASPAAEATSRLPTICLVATKVYYFGLGGGVHALLNGLEEDSQRSGWKSLVNEEKAISAGVARSVLSVGWIS